MPLPSAHPAFAIVKLAPQDWQRYREIRLEALQKEPRAFGSRYADALAMPDSFWIGRLSSGEPWSVLLFAEQAGRLVGMIGAHEKEPAEAVIISVYVTAAARGQGIASALMQAVLDEIRAARRFQSVSLGVNPLQTAAVALYQKFGFTVVFREPKVFSDDSEGESLRMVRPLV